MRLKNFLNNGTNEEIPCFDFSKNDFLSFLALIFAELSSITKTRVSFSDEAQLGKNPLVTGSENAKTRKIIPKIRNIRSNICLI